MSPQPNPSCKIDKQQLTALIFFAMRNIPEADEPTLSKFLELISTTGSFGSLTLDQLKEAMRIMIKFVPNTCDHSLMVVVELLRVHLPLQLEATPMLLD